MKIHVIHYKDDGRSYSKGFANLKAAKTFKSHLKRGLIKQHSCDRLLKINKAISVVNIPISAKGLIEAINY